LLIGLIPTLTKFEKNSKWTIRVPEAFGKFLEDTSPEPDEVLCNRLSWVVDRDNLKLPKYTSISGILRGIECKEKGCESTCQADIEPVVI